MAGMTEADLLRENGMLRKRVEELELEMEYLVKITNRAMGEGSEVTKAAFLETERNARNDALEEAAKKAESEPELPGEPPEEVIAAMVAIGPVENARASCRTTKEGIASAIRALKTTQPEATRPWTRSDVWQAMIDDATEGKT